MQQSVVIHPSTGGKSGNGTVGGCGRDLTYCLGAAIARDEDARRGGGAILSGEDIAAFIQCNHAPEHFVLRNQPNGDENAVDFPEYSGIPQTLCLTKKRRPRRSDVFAQ